MPPMSQASAVLGARSAAAAGGGAVPLHMIWGRLEDLSAADSSRTSGSSERVVRLGERLLEGVQVLDSPDTSTSNSREQGLLASGGLLPGASAGPSTAAGGPGIAESPSSRVRAGGAAGSGSGAPAGAAAEASGKLSRRARAHDAIFGPMGEAPLASEGASPAALGGAREEPSSRCYDQELHDSGQCRPCHHFLKKGWCVDEDACRFCHLQHDATRRLRPCKEKRERCKNMMEEALATGTNGVMQRLGEMSERSSLQGSYVRTVMAIRAKP